MNNDKASRAIFELAAAQLKEQGHKFGVDMNIEFTDNPSTSEDGLYIGKATLERFGFHTYPRGTIAADDADLFRQPISEGYLSDVYREDADKMPRHPQPAGEKFGEAAKVIKEAIVDPKRVPMFLRAKPKAARGFLRVSDERKVDPYTYTEVRFPTTEVYLILLDVLKKAILMAQNTGYVVVIRSFTEYEQTETPLACPGQEAYWADVDRAWGQMYVGDFVLFERTPELDSLFHGESAVHELSLARVEFKKMLKSLIDAEEKERPLPSVGVLSSLSKRRPHVQLHTKDLAIGADLCSRLSEAVGMAHESGFKVEVARDKLHLTNDKVGPFTSAPATLRLFVDLDGQDFSWLSNDWREALYNATVSISAGAQRNSPTRVFGEVDMGYGGIVRPTYADRARLSHLLDCYNPGSAHDDLVAFYATKPSEWFNTVEARERVFATDKVFGVQVGHPGSAFAIPTNLIPALTMAKTSGYIVEFTAPDAWRVTGQPTLQSIFNAMPGKEEEQAGRTWRVRDYIRYSDDVPYEHRMIGSSRAGSDHVDFNRVNLARLVEQPVTFVPVRSTLVNYGAGLQQAHDHLLAKKERAFAPMAELNETLPETALTRMFRSILIGRGVTATTMEEAIVKYLQNTTGLEHQELVNARRNLKKELAREHMSWNTFCKGLHVLGIEDFALTAEIGHNVRQVVKVPATRTTQPSHVHEAAQAATFHADSHTLRVAAITTMYLKDHAATRDQLSTMWGSLFTQLLIEARIDDAELFARITAYFDAQPGNKNWPRDMVNDLVAESTSETMKYESFVLFLDILGMRSPQLCVMGPMEIDGMDDLINTTIYIDGLSIGGTEEEDSGEEVVLPKEQLISSDTYNIKAGTLKGEGAVVTDFPEWASDELRAIVINAVLVAQQHGHVVTMRNDGTLRVSTIRLTQQRATLVKEGFMGETDLDNVACFVNFMLDQSAGDLKTMPLAKRTELGRATMRFELTDEESAKVAEAINNGHSNGRLTVGDAVLSEMDYPASVDVGQVNITFIDLPDISEEATQLLGRAISTALLADRVVTIDSTDLKWTVSEVELGTRLNAVMHKATYPREVSKHYVEDFVMLPVDAMWLGGWATVDRVACAQVVITRKGEAVVAEAPQTPVPKEDKGVMTYRPLHDGYVDFIAKVSQEDVLINGKPIQGQWPMFIEFALKVARAENKRVRVISPERIAVLGEDAMRPGAKRRKHLYVNDFLDLAPEFEGAIALDEDAVASYNRLMRSRVVFK